MLANWLREPLMNKLEIIARQGAVKELAGLPEWRIHLQAHGMVAQEEKKDLENLLEWLSVKPMFNAGFFKVARILIPLASFIMVTILATDFISMQLFLIYLILPLSITGYYTKRINHRHMMLSKKVELLSLYAIRFRMIESGVFTSEFMKGLSGKLKSGNQLASSVIKHLGRITSSLDTRLNLLAGFILNIFLLWDVRQMMRLEQWQIMHKQNLPIWFEALSQTEAIASMSGFSAANPGFVFPEISTDIFQIKANKAGHPLIPKEQRIDNDIQLTNKGHFNIVTGANMAGKSTYLRTIGVNMVLALSGAPVCAKAFICYPAPVFTSLRTTDSLSTNQSFIATHDLELGSLEKTFPDEVINYHFEAEISGDELHFDYKLKPGIARNMNATFLMQRMGITI
jgi:DNA mismatch repair ATPase MutS